MSRKLVLLFAACALAVSSSCAPHKPFSDSIDQDSLPPFNRIVLKTISEYPTNGTHGYWWPRNGEGNYSGASEDLYFQGSRVMTGEPQGRTYCCGLTLEVFLRSYQNWLEDHGGEKKAAFTAEDWPEFQRLWFVEKLNGPGPSAALDAFGLGEEIDPRDALPGDFVQIWRTKNKRGKMSGHSVVFLGWVRNDDGDAVGFHYWSTQPGTNGISERVEYYGMYGGLSTDHTHFGRVTPRTNDEPAPEKSKKSKESGKSKESK